MAIGEIVLNELQNRLVLKLQTDLILSEKQAKQIVIHVGQKEIMKTMFDVKSAQRVGRIETNLGAYAFSVFKKKYKLK